MRPRLVCVGVGQATRAAAGLALGVLLVPVACGCGRGGDGSATGGGTTFNTLAYVVTECRENASGFFARQRLEVRHGEGPPVKVTEFAWTGPLPGAGLCQIYATTRYGPNSVFAGAFQRIGVTPDGSGVVFEVTDDFSINAPNQLVPPDREGIFLVRADGTGLRRLGPASRAVNFILVVAPTPTGFAGIDYAFFSFSPDGRSFAFTDLGPAPSGDLTMQVFVQDVATGARGQITRLPTTAGAVALPTRAPVFVTARRIGFLTYANADGSNPTEEPLIFSVDVDGSDLRREQPVGSEGAVNPLFAVTGGGRVSAPIGVGDANEVFSFDGTNLLQLTRFGRVDTGTTTFPSVDGSRIFFDAAADPFGTNPSHNCQFFSIDALGGNMRQITHFHEVDEAGGCNFAGLPGCGVAAVNRFRPSQDARTGAVVLYTSCDPAGGVSTGGEYYALEPDGSGLRALTETYGARREVDGTLMVEMPGPAAYGPYQ